MSWGAYRSDIDGLRGIAVLSVVIFHAFPATLPGGFVGVDIFFVISGYLISSIILEGLALGKFSFVDFYVRRIRRIFPALLVVLLAVYVFGWFGLLVSEYRQLGSHIAAGAGFVSNLMLWHEIGYFDNAAATKPLLHLWSLGVEEQFYLIWPLLLWLAHRLRLNLLTVTAAIAAVSFALNVRAVRTDLVAAFYSPQTRFWELMVGAALAGLVTKGLFTRDLELECDRATWRLIFSGDQESEAPVFRNTLSIVGIAFIAASFFLINDRLSFPGWWAVLPVVGTAMVTAGGRDAWVNRTALSQPVLVGIGLISYPLYLWHWPVLTFARLMSVEPPSMTVLWGALGISVLLAILTYAAIERPLRFGSHRQLKAASLLLAMVLVGWLGFDDYRQGGQPYGKPLDMVTKIYQAYAYTHGPERDGSCDTTFPQFASFDGCRLSKPSALPEIVIIGDSHSAQYFSNLATALPDRVVMNINQHACLPFATYVSPECDKKLGQTYAFIAEQKSIRSVYLAGFWYHLLVGGFAREIVSGGVLNDTNYADARSFQARGEALIAGLLRSGKEVVFMKDNPDLDFNPLVCLRHRPLDFLEKVRIPCALDRGAFELRSAGYDGLIEAMTAKISGLKFFDTKDVLCDERRCWAMKDDKLLYHDMHHLSDYGARLVVGGLLAASHR